MNSTRCAVLLGLLLGPLVTEAAKPKAVAAPVISRGDWARFLQQATFGPRPQEIEGYLTADYPAWISAQVALPPTRYPDLTPFPSNSSEGCPSTVTDNPNCVRDHYSMYPLQVHFFKAALTAPDQLRQRVAFALSQIFVVSGVRIRQPSSLAPFLNVLVDGAFGNFRDLIEAVTLNPAMGQYLDMVNSLAATPNSTARPNENYARELLQLFSIGLEQLNLDGSVKRDASGQALPTFAQETVEGFTRAFTGWTYATLPGATPRRTNPANFQAPMEVYRVNGRDVTHDHAAKPLLNYPGARQTVLPANQDAAVDLREALDNLAGHPNIGPFLARRLIQQLVSSNPSSAYIARVASVFNDNGQGVRGDLKATVTQILLDPEARQAPESRPDGGKLREPVLFLTTLLRGVGAESDGILNSRTQPLGEDVFRAPSVFNYYPARFQIPGTSLEGPEFALAGSAALIARANLVNTLVYSKITSPAPDTGTFLSFVALDALAAQPDPGPLLDALSATLLQDAMSPVMRATLQRSAALACTASAAGSCSNAHARAQAALYLVASSAAFQIQR